MLTEPNQNEPSHSDPGSTRIWNRRLIILLTILAAIALAVTILWGISHITTSVLVVVIAALIAYAIAPAVEILHKVMPRALAILLAYLIVIIILGVISYYVVSTAIIQIGVLVQGVGGWLKPGNSGPISLLALLLKLGLSQAQINALGQQIAGTLSNLASSLAGGILPLLGGVAGGMVNILLTVVISIYLLIYGARAFSWMRNATPISRRGQLSSTIEILQRVVGGYIRGQILLCTIIGFLVGLGLFIIGFPFAVLMGVLTFVTEFIPVLGTIFAGSVAILLALTLGGWVLAIKVLIFFVLVHIFEGYILSPRLIGNAVQLNPAIMLIALTVGSELFGVFGAIFAAPTAGLLQALFTAFWIQYRQTHKDEFSDDKDDKLESTTKKSDAPNSWQLPPLFQRLRTTRKANVEESNDGTNHIN
jgi:predicted PurR-regulated permease PerM